METTPMNAYTFGKPSDAPFLFSLPPPATPKPNWAVPEIQDIQMNDPSPVRPGEGTDEYLRPIKLGAVKRVRKQREKRLFSRRAKYRNDTEDESDVTLSEDSSPQRASHSTHYTLNMATPGPDPPHLPYTLLGLVK
jgi:hypothetical protein